MQLLPDALEIPIEVADEVDPPPLTIQLEGYPAGAALESIITNAGLRHEMVPAIEVRPEEDVYIVP